MDKLNCYLLRSCLGKTLLYNYYTLCFTHCVLIIMLLCLLFFCTSLFRVLLQCPLAGGLSMYCILSVHLSVTFTPVSPQKGKSHF